MGNFLLDGSHLYWTRPAGAAGWWLERIAKGGGEVEPLALVPVSIHGGLDVIVRLDGVRLYLAYERKLHWLDSRVRPSTIRPVATE